MSRPLLQIIFENNDFIAINKPSGLLSIPDRFNKELPSVLSLIKAQYDQIYPVHRLDKETSGILVLAKSADAHKLLNELFEKRLIYKEYLCICEGWPLHNEGIIDKAIAHSIADTGRMMIHPKGKESQTQYILLERFKNFSLIKVLPKTGRTHQIRIHMESISCPLLCDPIYGRRTHISIFDIKSKVKVNFDKEPSYLLARTALHASKLSFEYQSVQIELEAELAKDFAACLKQIRRWQS